MRPDRQIREREEAWEFGPQDDRKVHLRCFRAFSLSEKIQAVEKMCQTARYFQRKFLERRPSRKD